MRDRHVVITGAAGGIGSALAHRFAQEGAQLGLLDLHEAGAAALAEELRDKGARASAAVCDVTDPDDCVRAMDELRRAQGAVEVLVNNAGITHLGRFQETAIYKLQRVMEVNFYGAVYCTRAALDDLIAQHGRIGVLSSVAGFAPLVDRTAYAASKHALHGFFDTLRAEHAEDGLSVTLVCPSFTRTGIGANATASRGEPREVRTTAGPIATPQWVADAAIKGIAARKRLVLPTLLSRASWWLARFAPRLYERRMRAVIMDPES